MSSERLTEAEARVAADEWDLEAWQTLCTCAGAGSYEAGEPIYRRLQAQFPTAGRFWKARVEHAGREGLGVEEIKKLYEEGVRLAGMSVELWRSYASFVRERIGGILPAEVFERALAAVGLDLGVHALWTDYIEYVKQGAGQPEQKRDALRKLYQKAIATPMNNLEIFWRAYESFESSNPALSSGLLAAHQPAYIAARTEARARKHRLSSLATGALATPPRGRPKDAALAAAWRKFIELEASNLHELDAEKLPSRIRFAYEAALVVLYRYPDTWIAYANYFTTVEKDLDEAGKVLDRAMEALPCNVAVAVAAANGAVRKGDSTKAIKVFEKLISNAPTVLAYIEMMRMARKVQSKDAARKVFMAARRKLHDAMTFHLYVAAAQMEYYINKEKKVARNIFELGFKTFPKRTELAYEYVGFLWHINEWEYAKVVLENVLKNNPGDRRLWDRYIEYEHSMGDVVSVDKLYARRNTVCNIEAEPPIARIIAQATYLDLQPLSSFELGVIEKLDLSLAHSTKSVDSGPGRSKDSRANGGAPRSGNGRRARGAAGQNGSANAGSGKGLEASLRRLVAALPTISAPPPKPEFVFSQVLQIPDRFEDTPAGRGLPPGTVLPASSADGADSVGVKRPAQDSLGGPVAPPQPQPQNQPVTDIFRARQALKQSRTR